MDRYLSVQFTADKFAIITLNDGENRLNNNSIAAWNKALDVVERSDSKALITTGKGKFYSNGVDLDWIKKKDPMTDIPEDFSDNMNDLFWRIMHFAIPTVAILNGHAFAGGAVLALCHDYRVMNSKRGWLCLNEVKINIRFPTLTVEILSRKMKRTNLIRDVVVFGKRFTAQEAFDKDLVDVVCDSKDFILVAKNLALELLGQHGLHRNSLQTMKKDLYIRTLYPKSKF